MPGRSGLSGSPRPVISYATGTRGLADDRAPSRPFACGADYENANIVAALRQGCSVLVTDYTGFTTEATPTDLIGKAEAKAALDIFRAAARIPWGPSRAAVS